jgi:hypothetical protein
MKDVNVCVMPHIETNISTKKKKLDTAVYSKFRNSGILVNVEEFLSTQPFSKFILLIFIRYMFWL